MLPKNTPMNLPPVIALAVKARDDLTNVATCSGTSKVKRSFDCCLIRLHRCSGAEPHPTPRQLMLASKKETQRAAGQSAHDSCSDCVWNAAKACIGETAQNNGANTGEDIGVGRDFPFPFTRWPLVGHGRFLPSANCALPLEADDRQFRIDVIWLNEMDGQWSRWT